MGNKNLANQFKSANWELVQTIWNREILRNTQSNIYVEKHYSISNYGSFQHRYINNQLYKWRKQLDPSINIVKMYQFQIKQQRFGIQQDQYVYTQKINRLSQGKIYSKPQGFLLIMQLLQGLVILFKKFGLFNVDLFLIGLSMQGKGKAWINENYAKNSIQQKNSIQTPTSNEQLIIVNNLVRLIKQRVYNDDFMPQVFFPENMSCLQTIAYINEVRNQFILFRVNKIYLNRSQFKQDYDLIYKNFMMAQRQPQNRLQQINPQIAELHVMPQYNQQLILPQRQVKIEKQKTMAFLKVKKQASQTLSSDSNSRAKKQLQNSTQNSQVKKKMLKQQSSNQVKKVYNQNKIHIQQMIDQKDFIENPKNVQPQTHKLYASQQFKPSFSGFAQNNQRIIVHHKNHTVFVPNTASFQQINPIFNPDNQPFTRNNNLNPNNSRQFYRQNIITNPQNRPSNPILEQRPVLNIVERPIQPVVSVPFHPLNNNPVVLNNINSNPPAYNMPLNRHISLNSKNMNFQKVPIKQNFHNQNIPSINNAFLHQNLPNQHIQGNSPLNPQFHNSGPGMVQNMLKSPTNFNQGQKTFKFAVQREITQKQQQDYINNGISNVELCQSVMLQKGQIQRNLMDL